ncbi:MAG: hypothetical protein M0P29_11205 [Sphaerochaetaceae bacterium]|jgi:hypothetical protein|nr:hypothetical protein [Sphaerochaetaceae bacterium]
MTKVIWTKAEPPTNKDKAAAYWEGILTPGTIVMTKDNQVCLIGDVNEYLGACDDCMKFTHDDIVQYTNDLVVIMTEIKERLRRGNYNVVVTLGVR